MRPKNLTNDSSVGFEGISAPVDSPGGLRRPTASYNADGQVTGTSRLRIGDGIDQHLLLRRRQPIDRLVGLRATTRTATTPTATPTRPAITTGAGNEMTNSPGVTYTYDNDGNMITATTGSGTTTYTYDYENRLTNVEIDGTMVATYTYDALGRRIGIDDSGTQTWTVYNGKSADANPYADFNSSGTLKMRYLDGLAVDEVLARTDSSGNTSWYLTDQVGSVVAIASTSAVLDEIIYDPFGNIVTQTDASEADRFMFAGMEYDSTTGLYYDHARYYDAAIGRFVSQDPMGFAAGDTNLYRYVGNDPTARVDTSGMDDRWDKLFPADLWMHRRVCQSPQGSGGTKRASVTINTPSRRPG